MAEELFHVVFRGDIADGFALQDVKARFAQLFKLDPSRVDPYFSGKPTALKKDCDRATADKFRAALQQIGAVAEVRSATPVTAPAAAAPSAAAVTAPPAPAPVPAPAAKPAVAVDPWSLSPQGGNLVRPDEIAAAAPVQVSIDHISVVKRNPFAADAEPPLEADRVVVAPALDLSAYEVASAGAALAEYETFVPLDLDLSALSLDAPGADLLRADEQLPQASVEVDISDLSLAPPGGDLGQIAPPAAPPPPSTDHLSIQK